MLTLSVIIVNYNTSQLCADCVRSLRSHAPDVDNEIIIVDNNSRADQVLKLKRIPDVRMRFLPRNIGFGRANNVGMAMARGRYVFLLNPDTLFINDSLSVLLNYMDLHSEVGACGATLLDARRGKIHAYARFFPSPWVEMDTFFRHIPARLLGFRNMDYNRDGRPMEVAYITGADLMLRRAALDRVGGFDPSFFMYYEETELCFRLHRHGWRVVHVPAAEIIHLEGKSQDDSLARYRRVIEGRRVFMRKRGYCYGNVSYLLCMLLSVIGFALFAQFGKSYRMGRKIPVFITVNFRRR